MLALTAAGRKLYRMLDERSNRQVAGSLEPLPSATQDAMARAMHTVMEALHHDAQPPIAMPRGLQPGDLGWIVQRHGEVYAREYGWAASFEALVARIMADYVDNHRPGLESAWMAEIGGQRAGF